MNLFDEAMALEQEGEALYTQFVAEAPEKGLKYLFSWLAEQEHKHYEIFKKMKDEKTETVKEISDLEDIRDIFDGWKDSSRCLDIKVPQAEVYRRALEIENKSISVYEGYAKASIPPWQKDIFLAIANEEKRHRWMIENIIDHITKPEVWAENAKFSHLDPDYYL